jgi:endonuclease YncB( thermonuclease family)
VGRRRAGGGGEIGVAEAILDAGLARYRPDAAAHPCRDLLLAAEAEARAGKTGLWADPFYEVLAAGDRAVFASSRKAMVPRRRHRDEPRRDPGALLPEFRAAAWR